MAHASKIRLLADMYHPEEIAETRAYVDQLFDNAPDRYDAIRENPFTCGDWVPRLDPIKAQKEAAVRAVLARRWYATNGPVDADLQPLPLGYNERESLKKGGATHVLAWYARSLDVFEYDVIQHPSFYDYACGVMASSEHAPAFITADPLLQRRFMPRPLSGLISGLIWLPPRYEPCRTSIKSKSGKR